MPEEVVLDLKIDEKSIMQQLRSIEEKRKDLDNALDKTKKKSKETWLLAVGVAQASWNLTTTLLEAQGVKVSALMRSAISGVFSTIAILKPILAVEAVTPGMQVAAAFGFAQIALSIVAAAAAEQEAAKIESNFQQGISGIGAMGDFIGSFNFK